jgi:hypothetical protein
VITGALVAGGVFVATQEQRMGENQHRLMRSLAAAEDGIPELIGQWDPGALNGMRSYPRDTFLVGYRATETGTVTGSLWRLNRTLYFAVLTGEDDVRRVAGAAAPWRGGGARQRLGVLARIRPIRLPSHGVITAQGDLRIEQQARVHGGDQIPNSSWTDCRASDSMRAGVHLNGTLSLAPEASIEGDPPLRVDSAISDAIFDSFGELPYTGLTDRATVRLDPGTWVPIGPSTVAGMCNRGDVRNWGDGQDHGAPCGDHFPVVHVTGDLTLLGGQGQGVLLVDGDLDIAGPFEYFGVIIVRGSLSTAGEGTSSPQLYGSLLLKNENGDASYIGGATRVQSSSCAIARALSAISPLAIARSRGWMMLH